MTCEKRNADEAFVNEAKFFSINAKRHVAEAIQTHKEACTLRLLQKAQIDLARGVVQVPVFDHSISCEDCGQKLTDEELETDHICSGCYRVVCKFCSLDSIYRNNGLECLECLRT